MTWPDHLSVVVINLTRRPQRWADFQTRWEASAEAHRSPHRFEAVDRPARGHLGCLESHLAVLTSFPGPLLVLEDDAVFAPSFTLDLSPPQDWAVAWLGGQHRAAPHPAEPGWVRPVKLVRSHAYLVLDPGAFARQVAQVPRVDPFFAWAPVPQYAQHPFSVGQAAGLSDTGCPPRSAAQFWQG